MKKRKIDVYSPMEHGTDKLIQALKEGSKVASSGCSACKKGCHNAIVRPKALLTLGQRMIYGKSTAEERKKLVQFFVDALAYDGSQSKLTHMHALMYLLHEKIPLCPPEAEVVTGFIREESNMQVVGNVFKLYRIKKQLPVLRKCHC